MNTTPAGQVGPAIKALYPRQMGALPLLYPILNDLQVRQTVNELAPTEADIDLGRIVVLLTLNRLLAPSRCIKSRTGWPRRCCRRCWASLPSRLTTIGWDGHWTGFIPIWANSGPGSLRGPFRSMIWT